MWFLRRNPRGEAEQQAKASKERYDPHTHPSLCSGNTAPGAVALERASGLPCREAPGSTSKRLRLGLFQSGDLRCILGTWFFAAKGSNNSSGDGADSDSPE